MRNCLSIFFVLFLLVSCGSGNIGSHDSQESKSIDTLNIEKFAYDFYRTHANIANNSITRKEAAKEFQEQFKEAVNNSDLLKDIPMTLRSLKEQKNGQYTAHFWNMPLDRDYIAPFESLNFDIAVTLPKEVAISLVEKSDYILDVTYISHIDNIKAFQHLIGYKDWVRTNEFELSPNEQRYDNPQTFSIDLGMMLVDFNEIRPYYKQ